MGIMGSAFQMSYSDLIKGKGTLIVVAAMAA